MAIPQSKNTNGKNQSTSSARFRQRKISVKQPLTIYKQKDLPATDLANELEPSHIHHLNSNGQQRDLHSFETGVDKNEEDEVHLQQVINAAQKALLSSKDNGKQEETKEEELKRSQVYIPTPDASKLWLEASKYYNDHSFLEPEANIKYSAQVEDAIGVAYNMDEIDDEFLHEMNKKYPTKKNEAKCTEVEFEIIVDKLETVIEEKQPFLSMDPTNILTFKELSAYILEEFQSSHKNHPYIQIGSNLKYISSTTLKERLSKELNYQPFVTMFDKDPLNQENFKNLPRSINKLLDLFGEPIYNHWKGRKIERKGKPITPTLKFEDPNANEKDNDNDPYICFRRREFRQARKTRRADTIGIEKIRLLQKSLHRARDLMFNVSQREILKLDAYKSELKVFKLRCEAKTLKRTHNIVGDDYLFYPHKKKKIIKIKEEEQEALRAKRDKKIKDFKESSSKLGGQLSQVATQVDSGNSTQPYVKLPPSKIPDMDLITVSLVLKEKQDTIKRAVLDKLRKRKDMDRGYVNLTDNPYQPYFNISTNFQVQQKDLKHIPYSSIISSNLHQINTSSVINENLKKYLEDGKKPLPGMKTFSGKTGELIPSDPFPHLNTLLNDVKTRRSNGYIAQLLKNIETNNYNVYVNGFDNVEPEEELNQPNISDSIFRLRRRTGRLNRNFVDRRVDKDLSTLNTEEDKLSDEDSKENEIIDAYNSIETFKRSKSNWKFDDESREYETDLSSPFDLDPSRLNSISEDTQSIRFGSMLLSKSYELLRESVHHRQQAYMQQARLRALHQQQQQQLRNKNLNQIPRPNLGSSTATGSSTGTGTGSGSTGSGSGSRPGTGSPQSKLNRSTMSHPIRSGSSGSTKG